MKDKYTSIGFVTTDKIYRNGMPVDTKEIIGLLESMPSLLEENRKLRELVGALEDLIVSLEKSLVCEIAGLEDIQTVTGEVIRLRDAITKAKAALEGEG